MPLSPSTQDATVTLTLSIKLKDAPSTQNLNEYGKLYKPVLHLHILCAALHQSHQMRVPHHRLLSQSVSDSLLPEINTSNFNVMAMT
jgi:hypothetical protein